MKVTERDRRRERRPELWKRRRLPESVGGGNEGVREVSQKERARSERGGGVRRCLRSQTNVCLSVPLGRRVSAPPD